MNKRSQWDPGRSLSYLCRNKQTKNFCREVFHSGQNILKNINILKHDPESSFSAGLLVLHQNLVQSLLLWPWILLRLWTLPWLWTMRIRATRPVWRQEILWALSTIMVRTKKLWLRSCQFGFAREWPETGCFGRCSGTRGPKWSVYAGIQKTPNSLLGTSGSLAPIPKFPRPNFVRDIFLFEV